MREAFHVIEYKVKGGESMGLLKDNANSILKEELKNKGLKQKFVAEHIGIASTYLSRLLSGSKPLTAGVAIKLSRFLDAPVEKILN